MLVNDDNFQKTNVTLKMLIESKILLPGLELVCPNPKVRGNLNSDGSITVNIEGKEKKFDYLSGAARHIEKRSINGWIYWHVIINGEERNIGSFRDEYLKTKTSSQA